MNDIISKNNNCLKQLYDSNNVENINDKISLLSRKLNVWKFSENFHNEENINDKDKLEVLEKIYLNKIREK